MPTTPLLNWIQPAFGPFGAKLLPACVGPGLTGGSDTSPCKTERNSTEAMNASGSWRRARFPAGHQRFSSDSRPSKARRRFLRAMIDPLRSEVMWADRATPDPVCVEEFTLRREEMAAGRRIFQ